MYLPVNYQEINLEYSSYTPNTIRPCNNLSYDYWFRSLFQRAQSVIKIEGMPDNWDENVKDFLFWCLFKHGYVAVFYNNKYGLSFQPCALNGFDFYYQFTEAIITNPKLKVTLQIHKECEILKLTPDYMGIFDIIDRYARRLSSIDPAVDMAIENAKFGLVYGARNKSGANFLKKVLDFINRGEPAVVADTSLLLPLDKVTKEDVVVDLSRKDIKNTYLGTELLQDTATILNEFDTEVGIPTVPYQKKERMVTDEATSKEKDATSRSHVWVDTMNGCFEMINELLDCNLHAVHNYDEETEVSENE